METTAAPSNWAVNVLSEPNDSVGQGGAYLFRTGSGTVGVRRELDYIRVGVSGGGTGFHFEFAAAPGQTLGLGKYDNAQRRPFRSSGHPGMDITSSSRGCNTISGTFTVLDITPDLSRLWITFEQHCEGGPFALFGEIRIGMPREARPGLLVSNQNIAWPADYPGVSGRPVPVAVANTGTDTLTVNDAEITDGADDFSILENQCTAPLGPGEQCVVFAGFEPTAPRTRRGVLTLTIDGRIRPVDLSGDGEEGQTSWVMHSDPGDWVGDGLDYSFTPQNSTIVGSGYVGRVDFRVWGSGHSFYATFSAGPGNWLLPGTYDPAYRYPYNDTSAGMDIGGDMRGCNRLSGSFSIESARYDGSHQLQEITISFVQHCEDEVPALSGTIKWRAGANDTVAASGATLTGEPIQPTYPASVILTGILVDQSSGEMLAGEPVYLYARRHGTSTWTYAGRHVMSADGFSLRVGPIRNTDYLAKYYASAGHSADASVTTIWVRPRVTMAANRTSGTVGTRFRFATAVGPNHAGNQVLLQRRKRIGTWRTVASKQLTDSSTARFVTRTRHRGRYWYRIVKPADSDHTRGVSRTVSIRIR